MKKSHIPRTGARAGGFCWLAESFTGFGSHNPLQVGLVRTALLHGQERYLPCHHSPPTSLLSQGFIPAKPQENHVPPVTPFGIVIRLEQYVGITLTRIKTLE